MRPKAKDTPAFGRKLGGGHLDRSTQPEQIGHHEIGRPTSFAMARTPPMCSKGL